MPKKRRNLSITQRSMFGWTGEEKPKPRKTDVPKRIRRTTHPEGYRDFVYTITEVDPDFLLTRRNKSILEFLKSTELTVQELADLVEVDTRSVYVELEYLRTHGFVEKREVGV